MDSIEPTTTTHSWTRILRVGKTHIHVIKIYQPLSTRVFRQFIRPPYTQFRLHIHRFVVTRHLIIMWPPTRAQPLSRPDQHHPYHTRAQPLDPSSHHTLNLQADCFSCSVHSLTWTQVHSQWQARTAISQSNSTTIYNITEFFCEHTKSFSIP